MALLPVIAFLAVLVLLDSYKLVRLSSVVGLLAAGAATALVSFSVHTVAVAELGLAPELLTRYVAPVVEECLKGACVYYLIRRHRVGFMVDAAISGFAVGAGFAVIENLHYFFVLSDPRLLLWILRGLGTAVMHGGVTAIMAILSKRLADRLEAVTLPIVAPGLLLAVAIHSTYNHFLVSPYLSAFVLLVTLPTLFTVVFRASEQGTRRWLGVGFDTDSELLAMVKSGRVSDTRVGAYLETMKAQLPGEILLDMIMLVRLHLELSIQGKGLLLAREAGFDIAPSADLAERLAELRYLEGSVGKTNARALAPIFNMSSKDLWQLTMLARQG